MRILPFICVGLLWTLASCNEEPVTQLGSKQSSPVSIQSTSPSNCLTHEQIVTKLYAMSKSKSQSESELVQRSLLEESQKSEACRSALIESIVKTMDLPASSFKDDGSYFNLWSEGAELLGDLKASEAIDFLIEHLDFAGGGFSTTMSHRPAVKAVKRIGPSAIPKLAEVLRQHHSPRLRMDSVYCLSSIGGPSAVQALKEALPLQTDRCVKGFVQASIEALDNAQQQLIDTNKWFSAFLCHS